ncbi:CYTH domain-containing protein [Paenibacillus camelliae]|uniref:CYTH domain-containing protein n=1 Tax=Paenibacillus camelliae TaxID=512410 RepID=UPI0020414D3A|nr:CYTH domain-containing protein [Paenibacillus camelliae]MCM3635577.1 CYTH domain-containing protein [Paenibacillus camelliae]
MAITEKELKLLLEHDSFTKILNYAPKCPNPIRQTNYYFDTLDFRLDKAGITLRIRNEDGQWLLCLKIKSKSESRFISSLEIERQISNKEFEYFKSNPSEILGTIAEKKHDLKMIIDSSEICFLGYIQNERLKVRLFNEYTFELDHSFFPGGNESFELEVEGVNSELECEYILSELKGLGINYHINKKSKYKRFVEYISSNNNVSIALK